MDFLLSKKVLTESAGARVCVCVPVCAFVERLLGARPCGAGVFSVGQVAVGLLAHHAVSKHEQNKLLRLKNVVLMQTGRKRERGQIFWHRQQKYKRCGLQSYQQGIVYDTSPERHSAQGRIILTEITMQTFPTVMWLISALTCLWTVSDNIKQSTFSDRNLCLFVLIQFIYGWMTHLERQRPEDSLISSADYINNISDGLLILVLRKQTSNCPRVYLIFHICSLH